MPSTTLERDFNALTPRILVVEDNTTSQIVITGMLSMLGYSSFVANNGSEACEALKLASFDAILMDVKLPDISGQELTRLIRHGGITDKSIVIIAQTAFAMAGDRERFLADGMNDYIAKPLDLHALAEVLEKNIKKNK